MISCFGVKSSPLINEFFISYPNFLFKKAYLANFKDISLNETNQFKQFKLTSLSISNTETINFLITNSFPNLVHLCLHNTEIYEIDTILNGPMLKLQYLRLSKNPIEYFSNTTFNNLPNLRYLEISFCLITNIDKYMFNNQKKLIILKITKCRIINIQSNAFDWLINLKELHLNDTKIKSSFSKRIFKNLSKIEKIFSNNLQLCCLSKILHLKLNVCYPRIYENSTCSNLIISKNLRTTIWILGLFGLIFNSAVILLRIHSPKILHDLNSEFLTAADFSMITYLILIASADKYYNGDYYEHDESWRQSSLCKFIGFLYNFAILLSSSSICITAIQNYLYLYHPSSRLQTKRLYHFTRSITSIIVLLESISFLFSTETTVSHSTICTAYYSVNENGKYKSQSIVVIFGYILQILTTISLFLSFSMIKKLLIDKFKPKTMKINELFLINLLIISNSICLYIFSIYGRKLIFKFMHKLI